jgi:hypothetical protein
MIHEAQKSAMVQVYDKVLRENEFPHIGTIDFAHFGVSSAEGTRLQNEAVVVGKAGNDIRIYFSVREPAAKLEGINEGMLLVAMFAWDGGAFVGNEYWLGQLTNSGDPAAACCSSVAETLNPHFNPNLTGEKATVFSISH